MKPIASSRQLQGLRHVLRAISVLIIVLHAAACTPLGLSWFAAPKERIDVIAPEGYEGPILIAYQVPDGVIPEKKGDVWQYYLQDDGALLIQTDPLPGVGQFKFFYRLQDGTLQPIPPSSCFDEVEYDGVVVCTGGTYEVYNTRTLRPNESYAILRLKDKAEWDFDRLYDRYLDQLTVPEHE